jgi:hypothetical protein
MVPSRNPCSHQHVEQGFMIPLDFLQVRARSGIRDFCPDGLMPNMGWGGGAKIPLYACSTHHPHSREITATLLILTQQVSMR